MGTPWRAAIRTASSSRAPRLPRGLVLRSNARWAAAPASDIAEPQRLAGDDEVRLARRFGPDRVHASEHIAVEASKWCCRHDPKADLVRHGDRERLPPGRRGGGRR